MGKHSSNSLNNSFSYDYNTKAIGAVCFAAIIVLCVFKIAYDVRAGYLTFAILYPSIYLLNVLWISLRSTENLSPNRVFPPAKIQDIRIHEHDVFLIEKISRQDAQAGTTLRFNYFRRKASVILPQGLSNGVFIRLDGYGNIAHSDTLSPFPTYTNLFILIQIDGEEDQSYLMGQIKENYFGLSDRQHNQNQNDTSQSKPLNEPENFNSTSNDMHAESSTKPESVYETNVEHQEDVRNTVAKAELSLELERLAALKSKGLLTENEFLDCKRRILKQNL